MCRFEGKLCNRERGTVLGVDVATVEGWNWWSLGWSGERAGCLCEDN